MSAQLPPETKRQADLAGRAVPTGPLGRVAPLWSRAALLVIVLGSVAAGGMWISSLVSPTSSAPRLTHTVSHSDLVVAITEQGTLESSDNVEIKCRVRGFSTVTWVIESGTFVQPGDELVRLDTKAIEETVSQGKTDTHVARATLAQSTANVATAEISVQAYLDGPYRSNLKRLEKELAIAEAHLATAQKMLEQSDKLFQRGYITDLEVKGNAYTVTEAQLEVNVKQTQIDVLKRFTKAMQMETLHGNLTASRSKKKADEAGLKMEISQRDRALQELKDCVMVADRPGLVIYPSAAAWKNSPDIAEGATVRKDQVLLLMPDLSQMQVKVGVHESIIDRMRTGLKARVVLPDRTLEAEVTSVASVTRPAGWWTGNIVKYDTVIQLPHEKGLKPGMSAEVEIILAEHKGVLTVPVAAVVETKSGHCCWVSTPQGVERRPLELGDSNEVFIHVQGGLTAGEKVVLNPLTYIAEAQESALRTLEEPEPPLVEVPQEPSGDQPASASSAPSRGGE